jgi:GTP-binding protein
MAFKVKESTAVMEIGKATFLKSSSLYSQLPPADRPEYAFVGRSNVGKSSLINMVLRAKLAQTSATPGKTRLINHFDVDGKWFLVDLPGYGFARVSKGSRKGFEEMIHDYATQRKSLVAVFVLVDSRLAPQALDLEFMEFLGVSEVPFAIIFTKLDKLSGSERPKNLAAYKKVLKQTWDELPPIFLSSAETREGRKEILDWMEANMDLWRKP